MYYDALDISDDSGIYSVEEQVESMKVAFPEVNARPNPNIMTERLTRHYVAEKTTEESNNISYYIIFCATGFISAAFIPNQYIDNFNYILQFRGQFLESLFLFFKHRKLIRYFSSSC